MAKKLYKAKIGSKHIMVDLEHLPYGEFNKKTPLVITEKVVLEKPLQRTNLDNVSFAAGIEMPNTILPNFDDQKYTLIVEPIEITVAEYLKNPFARYNIILDFDARNYIVQSETPEPAKQPVVAKPVVEAKPAVEQKPVVVEQKPENVALPSILEAKERKPEPSRYAKQTDDYMNLNEIYSICKNNPLIQSFGLSESELLDMIRKLMKDFNRQIMLSVQTNLPISCIESAKAPEILKKLQTVLSKKYKTNVKEEKTEIPSAPQQTRKQLESVKNFSVMPIKIKKYIPQRLWKDICKACGKHEFMKKSVIDNIYIINTDLNETRASTHVHFIDPQTLERKTSPYIKRENILCIVQSITNTLNKDNKRIIWTYVPGANVYVCTGVFTEHTKTKTGNTYAKVRDFASEGKDANGQPIDLSTVINNPNYLDVDDLWAEFNQLKNTQAKPETPAEIRSGNGPVKLVVQTEEPKPEIEQIKPGITTKKEEGGEPKKLVINPEKPVTNLSDIIVAQKQVEAVINLINTTINDHIQAISTEESTQKQIADIDLIRAALLKKQAIQKALSEMSDLDTLLAQIKNIHQR